MLLGVDAFVFKFVAFVQLRQAARILIVVVFDCDIVELQEALKLDRRAGGAERIRRAVAALDGDVGRRLLHFSRRHLARDRTLPNQLVQLGLVGGEVLGEVLGRALHVGRSHGLVGLLRVLRLGFILAHEGRDVAFGMLGFDQLANVGDDFGNDIDSIRSHVRDEADGFAADIDALVQPLRDLHGLLGAKAELAGRLLLERGGGERRVGVALDRLFLNRGDDKALAFDGGLDGVGRGFVLNVEALESLAVDGLQAGADVLVLGCLEKGFNGPVFVASEGLDLGFAVTDQPQRDRLDAASRARTRQLAPQHGR